MKVVLGFLAGTGAFVLGTIVYSQRKEIKNKISSIVEKNKVNVEELKVSP